MSRLVTGCVLSSLFYQNWLHRLSNRDKQSRAPLSQHNIWTTALFPIFIFIFKKMKRKLNRFHPGISLNLKRPQSTHVSGEGTETERSEVTRSHGWEVTVMGEEPKPKVSSLLTQGPSCGVRLAPRPPQHLSRLMISRGMNKWIPKSVWSYLYGHLDVHKERRFSVEDCGLIAIQRVSYLRHYWHWGSGHSCCRAERGCLVSGRYPLGANSISPPSWGNQSSPDTADVLWGQNRPFENCQVAVSPVHPSASRRLQSLPQVRSRRAETIKDLSTHYMWIVFPNFFPERQSCDPNRVIETIRAFEKENKKVMVEWDEK